MTDTPSPFAPFQLPTATPAAEPKPEKAARKPRKAKETAPSAAALADFTANADGAPTKPDRKKREKKAGIKAYAPKFELQTILAAASTLNENDFPLFEKLAIALDEAGKPQRDRVLEAIGKVFG